MFNLFQTMSDIFTSYAQKGTVKSPNELFSAKQMAQLDEVIKGEVGKGSIIAIGGGFDSDEKFGELAQKAISLTGKSAPRLLYIPSGSKDSPVEEDTKVLRVFRKFNCPYEILYVSKETSAECERKISNADIIYEVGGNLKFLSTHWGAKGVFAMMHKAYAGGAVLMGPSTGAMCWAERGYDDASDEKVWRVVCDFPFIGKDAPYEFFGATGLLPFCICPHFDNISWRQYDSEAKKLDIPSICIENGAAFIYHDGKFNAFLDNPKRKIYLYYPAMGIVKMDVTADSAVLDYVNAARLAERRK